MSDQDEFCRKIDDRVKRSMTKALIWAAAAALITSVIMYFTAYRADAIYSAINCIPLHSGTYFIGSADDAFSCEKISAYVKNYHIYENSIDVSLILSTDTAEKFKLSSQDFDVFIFEAEGNSSRRCRIRTIDDVIVTRDSDAEVLIKAENIQNLPDDCHVSVSVMLPRCDSKAEFILR